MELTIKLARLSEEERNRILADYYDEVFGGLDIDREFEQRMRSVTPDLPTTLAGRHAARGRHDTRPEAAMTRGQRPP